MGSKHRLLTEERNAESVNRAIVRHGSDYHHARRISSQVPNRRTNLQMFFSEQSRNLINSRRYDLGVKQQF